MHYVWFIDFVLCACVRWTTKRASVHTHRMSRALTKNRTALFLYNSPTLKHTEYVLAICRFVLWPKTDWCICNCFYVCMCVCMRTSNVIETEYHFTGASGYFALFCFLFMLLMLFFCFRKKETIAKEENRLKFLWCITHHCKLLFLLLLLLFLFFLLLLLLNQCIAMCTMYRQCLCVCVCDIMEFYFKQ